jgi:hypothetical protein
VPLFALGRSSGAALAVQRRLQVIADARASARVTREPSAAGMIVAREAAPTPR